VDNPNQLPNVVSFCSGYGGLELGISLAGIPHRTICYVEVEAFAIANLVNKMEAGQLDPAPIWTDARTFPSYLFRGRVDLLTGGYPCQPFSAAGQRGGAEDPRHLWPFIDHHISIMRPGRVFFENVEGHISLGLDRVLHDLEVAGYDPAWGIFSAAEAGAPHQRKRVYIMGDAQHDGHRARTKGGCVNLKDQTAHPEVYGLPEPDGFPTPDTMNYRDGSNLRQLTKDAAKNGARRGVSLHHHVHTWPTPSVHGNHNAPGAGEKSGTGLSTAVKNYPTPAAHEARLGYQDRSDPSKKGSQKSLTTIVVDNAGGREKCKGQLNPDWVEWLMGVPLGWTQLEGDVYQHPGWGEEPPIPRVLEGCEDRTDRIRMLGNGVVPQTAATAWVTLHNELEMMT